MSPCGSVSGVWQQLYHHCRDSWDFKVNMRGLLLDNGIVSVYCSTDSKIIGANKDTLFLSQAAFNSNCWEYNLGNGILRAEFWLEENGWPDKRKGVYERHDSLRVNRELNETKTRLKWFVVKASTVLIGGYKLRAFESANELYRSSDRRRPAKLVPTLADRVSRGQRNESLRS
jgi:hypothetical protein